MFKFLQKIFGLSDNHYSSRLELYLASKGITDTGQLEHYIRQFDRRYYQGGIL